MTESLPRGQQAVEVLHRFGLTQFANRFPSDTGRRRWRTPLLGQSMRLRLNLSLHPTRYSALRLLPRTGEFKP